MSGSRTNRILSTLSVLLAVGLVFAPATAADTYCQIWFPCEGYYITAWCNEGPCVRDCTCGYAGECVWYAYWNPCTGEYAFNFICCGMPL
jgi:hypothetical protein